MHILILGGNSLKNKAWVYGVEEAVKGLADSTEVHEYAHWQRERSFIDLDWELAAVAAKVADRATGEYIIVGKSMGAVLAAKGIAEGKLHPKACVLIGSPLREMARYPEILFKQWLESADCNLIFVQNRADPLGSADDLRDYLSDSPLASRRLIELPDDTHDYSDMLALRRAVEAAINRESGRPKKCRAVIFNPDQDQVLVIKREKPGVPLYFSFPGGHLEESDPSALDGLLRELDEELSLKPDEIEFNQNLIKRQDEHFYIGVMKKPTREFTMGGPEASADPAIHGTYSPVWLPLNRLKTENVLPKEVVELLYTQNLPNLTP